MQKQSLIGTVRGAALTRSLYALCRLLLGAGFLPLMLMCLSLGVLLGGATTEAQNAASQSTNNIDSIRRQLREMETRIQSEQQRLSRVQQEKDSISQRLKELDTAQKETRAERQEIQDSVVALSTEAERLKLTLFGARQQMEHQRARMHRRLVALYKTQKRSPSADYLFQADSTTDLLKRAKYLSRVTEHDQVYISQLSQVVRRGQDDRKKLEELLQRRRAKLAELTSLSEKLDQQKFQTASLLREQEAKAEQQQASVLALRLSANQLQRMLSEMMDAAPDSSIERELPNVVSLASLRGKLPFPVTGRVVQGYGKQRHTEFEDILFKKGLEVSTAPGALVKSVAAGSVLFRQELPGFGRVVIVDHGSRYYTLYGRLADIMVNVGQKVEKGERLAITGPEDIRGRNFYFELRHRGKAQNPVPYFSALPGVDENS